MKNFLAVDTGGTFTDIAVFDTEKKEVSYGKTLTNYRDLVDGVFEGIEEASVDLSQCVMIKHGTTQVINDLIQRSGTSTALITTRGFRDMLEIGRGNRPVPFDLTYQRESPLIPRSMCFEIDEKVDSKGNILVPLNHEQLFELVELLKSRKVEAVAISFINSYVNPKHEQEAASVLRKLLPGVRVSIGTELSKEWMEFERTSTTIANAYVSPKITKYITNMDHRLSAAKFNGSFYMMASNGGVLSLERTLTQPVSLVESGPVGGCIGAVAFAKALDIDRMIAFDMGGTTAKCAFIENAEFDVQPVYYVGGYTHGFPLRTPVLDIVEVGAGGGSIASVDEHGRLHVGPQSAGSDPGPVAFGKGGTEPTVTDANVILGRLGADMFMNGKMKIDQNTAKKAILQKVGKPLGYTEEDSIDKVANGIVTIANTIMMNAIKEISLERGYDMRECPLFVFGGGGPLHGSSLARELNIKTVIVPPYPGIFSALGMLMAEARIDETQTYRTKLTSDSVIDLRSCIEQMEKKAVEVLHKETGSDNIAFQHYLEMKYYGQLHHIKVCIDPEDNEQSIRNKFIEVYNRTYGNIDQNGQLEITGIRISAFASILRLEPSQLKLSTEDGEAQPLGFRSVYFPEVDGRYNTPIYRREQLKVGFSGLGPAIIEEYGSTTIVGVKDRFSIGQFGEIWIQCDEGVEE
jgi:N-methylhydantoinase A